MLMIKITEEAFETMYILFFIKKYQPYYDNYS